MRRGVGREANARRRGRGGHEVDTRWKGGAKNRGKHARRRENDSEGEGIGLAGHTRSKRKGKPSESGSPGQKREEDGLDGRGSDQTARRARSWPATGEETTVAVRTK